jgi:Protein of unknown function (DUF1592)/Protein of unknown function (DUF1588)/Protein of unknown function (DUF1595)/Protein of unknown function (DUF1585)/Protein of unknown function (DUF1587)
MQPPARALALFAALTGSACYTGTSRGPSAADETAGAGDDGGPLDTGSAGDDGGVDTDAEPVRPDPAILDLHTAIGVRRLSKLEYGNTIRDLLGVEGAELGLSDDQKVDFLSNNAHAKQLGLAELATFSLAAQDAATAALPSLALGDTCTPATADVACVEAWLPGFLRRAFRRPATTDEVARYRDLFAARLAAGDPVDESVRLVVEATLLSPYFLYRPELGTAGPGEPGPLAPYEIASRLSYLLWATMPDDVLLDAAEAELLTDTVGVTAQVERMLADPRVEVGVVRFVSEWLGTDTAQVIKKAAEVTEGLPPTLQQDLEQETRRFVYDAMLGAKPSLNTLLTSTRTYANETVASIYGVPGITGPEFRAVELDPEVRRGILTQPLLLAAHTKESGFSVVQMGRFVRERLLCQTVPPPPPGVDTTIDPSPENAGLTYRETLVKLTGESPCSACHQLLNAPGFAYMAYDSIGRVMTEDLLGRPLETDGVLADLDGRDEGFDDLVELADLIADSQAVRGCFARRYIEYAFGRTIAPEDVPLYHRLAEGLESGDGDFPAFIAALVLSDEFASTGPFAE